MLHTPVQVSSASVVKSVYLVNIFNSHPVSNIVAMVCPHLGRTDINLMRTWVNTIRR